MNLIQILLEELADISGDKMPKEGEVYSKNVLYWMGYLYRYWHCYTNEESKKYISRHQLE